MNFKKSFWGYRPAQVEEQLEALRNKLEQADSRRASLQDELNRLQQTEREISQKLAGQETEIRLLREENSHLKAEQSRHQNHAENIGTVYMKAFEAGRAIALTPRPRIEEYLGSVKEVTDAACADAQDTQESFSSAAEAITAMAQEIDEQTARLREQLAQLQEGIEGIAATYCHLEQVRQETTASIQQLDEEYTQSVSEYLQAGTENTAESDWQPEEALSNITVLEPAAAAEEAEEETAEEAPEFDRSVRKSEYHWDTPSAEEDEEDTEDTNEGTLSDFRDAPSDTQADTTLKTGTDGTESLLTDAGQTSNQRQNILNLLNKYQSNTRK